MLLILQFIEQILRIDAFDAVEVPQVIVFLPSHFQFTE